MAVVGKAFIRPDAENGQQPHYLHDIHVDADNSQDGVWSTGGDETVVENISVQGGGGGQGEFQFRIGIGSVD